MSTTSLNTITCLDQQESGGDEIYFKFADLGGNGTGQSVVVGGMDAGDTKSISGTFNFLFNAKVTMLEQDTFFDDNIQGFFTGSAPGHYHVTLGNSEMKYVLDYFLSA